MVVRSEPASDAWLPVIVMPERTPARTAYSSVALTNTAQATSISRMIIAIMGRKTNVNSRTSAPLQRSARDLRLLTMSIPPVLLCCSNSNGPSYQDPNEPATGVQYYRW